MLKNGLRPALHCFANYDFKEKRKQRTFQSHHMMMDTMIIFINYQRVHDA